MSEVPESAPPRVLLLDHTAEEGGAELALLRLAEQLLQDGGVELRAILFADGPLRERLLAIGVRTVVVPLDPRIATASRRHAAAMAARSALGSLRFSFRLARAIRGSGADLVVANSLKAAIFAAVAAPLAGRRWVWHLHDRIARDYLPSPMVTLLGTLAGRGPRAVVANSRATLGTLPRRARQRAVVAYPGLPAAAFDPADVPDEPPRVGIIGRISPTKGQREFLAAAAIVARSHPTVRFQVIGGALFGEDQYEAGLREQAAGLGLEQLEFTGWVSDAPTRLRRLSLLVHASPVPEPFGQVIVEAMAAGVPVVAAAAGGVLEILDPEDGRPAGSWRATRTGLLVRPGDPAALASAIRAALEDPAARTARAAAAMTDARVRFRIEETARIVREAWGIRIR